MKRCTVCGKEKSVDQFNKHNQTEDRLTKRCTKCINSGTGDPKEYKKHRQHERRLRDMYDMSLFDYVRLVDKQGGRCAICETETEKLHIDHDHETGKVRGLLCMNCNTALGQFKDDIEILKAAILYLI